MSSIYFLGNYKPMMCGIGDYTSFIARESTPEKWGAISFALTKCGVPLAHNNSIPLDRVWYGIPDRTGFSASVVLNGIEALDEGKNGDIVLWFQHENGIWPDDQRFVTMLTCLAVPKVVTFHTLHFQSRETPSGLRQNQYDLLRLLLPQVDAITVFSHGVYRAVTMAFPEYRRKVHVIRHGIHSYPGVSRLSRKEAKEKLNDYLLYEADLDRETREALFRHRVFTEPNTIVLGQTGFLSPAKYSEVLYPVRDALQQMIPNRRIVAARIGSPREDHQRAYAEQLRSGQDRSGKFFLETWLPEELLPVAQRAFDVNFYWPRECTQSGILAHALGVGAIVAGRDLEGVGETLREAGEMADTDLNRLMMQIREFILHPELAERIEYSALKYALEFSWNNQARRHYELADGVLHPLTQWLEPYQTLTGVDKKSDRFKKGSHIGIASY